jgi:serine/threonine protein kinase/tetratricopeptide (TPR) repeat protein
VNEPPNKPTDADRVDPAEEAIFKAARGIEEPQARRAYLEEACGERLDLRARVEALLRFHDEGRGLLASAPMSSPTAADERVVAAPGTRIGPYKLIEQIGEGGFGIVFLAEQQYPLQRRVALKVLKAGMDSAQVVARFEAERQALALMEHPNIAQVLDGGETAAGRPYFVMELVKGVPITRYCDEHRLTPRDRLALFVPVCHAVQHAHQKGIIHRDLKPTNVLVTTLDGQPVPKVIDFGVAKAMGQKLTERTLVTGFGGIVGTLEYMSPEQAEFNALDVDTRADIYSLGVMLYELLTGTTPLTKKNLQDHALTEILRLIREDEPPNPSTRIRETTEPLASISAQRRLELASLSKELRGELDWIVMKALEKDRTRRYETARDLARDLDRYLRNEAVEAGPVSARYRLKKLLSRHRNLLATGAAFVLLLVVALLVSSWLAVRATIAEGKARAQAEAAEQARSAESNERQRAEIQKKRAEDAESQARLDREKALAEKRRANDEAAIAKAVNVFLLKDLLGQADIRNQPGGGPHNPTITVRELLDRAAKAIAGKFSGQEQTEAAIRLTLGDAYQALGDYAEAEKHLERSLALRKQALGADHLDTLKSMNDLAVLYESRGRYADAEELYRRALEGRRAKLGDDHLDTLGSLNDLGTLFQARGRFAEAEPLLKQVLERRMAKLGDKDGRTLDSLNNLAALFQVQGRYDEAEPLYVRALAGSRATLGDDHPETVVTMANLATLYHWRGRYAEAEPLLKQALRLNSAKRGADHPSTVMTMHNLASLYMEQGNFDEAERMFKQVLDVRRRKLGHDHPNTLFSITSLASLYETCGRYELAEPLLSQVADVNRAKLGRDHPNTLFSLSRLASLDQQRGRYDKAEALFSEVLTLSRAQLGPDHPDVLGHSNNLAMFFQDRGRYKEAEPLLLAAIAGAKKKLGPLHPKTLTFIDNLAELRAKQGKPELAESELRETAELHRVKSGAGSLAYAGALASLTQNLIYQRKYSDAEPVARLCLAIRAKEEPGQWTTFHARSLLGVGLLGQHKYTEAEPLLREGYEGMSSHTAKLPVMIVRHRQNDVLTYLVRLYEELGKQDEATKWRKKLEPTLPPKGTPGPK